MDSSSIYGYSPGSDSSRTLGHEEEIVPSMILTNSIKKVKETYTESKAIREKWGSVDWDALLATNLIEKWRASASTKFYNSVSIKISQRFGLRNAGKSSGFYREWAAGFITCQADEGVFMFSHDFKYACLVSTDIQKAILFLRDASDEYMEGEWRRMGEVYDKDKPGQFPGEGERGKGEDDGGDEAYEYEYEYINR